MFKNHLITLDYFSYVSVQLEARMVGWMDKVSAIEGSINSETECLAKNMAEVYRLLLAAQVSWDVVDYCKC